MQRVRLRVVWAAVLLVAMLALAAGPAVAGQPAAGVAFSGAAARQHVEVLGGQIGSRPAGSANYDQAVQYAADQLRQWGYQPALQAFPVQTYDDRGSQLEVSAPVGQVGRLSADTLTYSVAGQVEAPLVAAGLGQVDELAGVDVRGKIALLKRGTLRFSDKVTNAANAGAVGVVVYNDSPGRVQGSLVRQEMIPAVTISGDDGQKLLDLLTAGSGSGSGSGPVTVRLAVDGSVEQRTSTNVVAELPGSRAGAGTVVIGGHLDTVSAGPGANDNGSGSAVTLELAHTLASQAASAPRPYTLRFVLFGAEELGLFGSRYYVESLSDAERQAILAMINLDMVGVGQGWRFGGTDDLVQRALGAATDLGERPLPLRGPLRSASDHASFLSAGLPAVFFYRTDDPNYHTANDRAEFVDADALGQAGTIALKVLDSLGQ
jgi:aminopeptidase YwaD